MKSIHKPKQMENGDAKRHENHNDGDDDDDTTTTAKKKGKNATEKYVFS